MPGTAADLRVREPFDAAQNVRGGGQYHIGILARRRDVRLMLVTYNVGAGRVGRRRTMPAIPETKAYVRDVIQCFLALTAGRTVRCARDCRATGAGAPEPAQAEAATIFVQDPRGAAP